MIDSDSEDFDEVEIDDFEALTPIQKGALDKAIEILGEHFDMVLVAGVTEIEKIGSIYCRSSENNVATKGMIAMLNEII